MISDLDVYIIHDIKKATRQILKSKGEGSSVSTDEVVSELSTWGWNAFGGLREKRFTARDIDEYIKKHHYRDLVALLKPKKVK